jgi:ribosomal protein S18 acetylase RimI-like enzyme
MFRGSPVAAIRTRRATPGDLETLVGLAIELGRLHEAHESRRFSLAAHATAGSVEATYRAFFEEQLLDARAAILVAEVNERVVGYAFLRMEAASFLDLSPQAGWIHDLYLIDGERGAGFGEILLREGIATLRALGAQAIMLSVAPWNERAQRLFAATGFRQTMIECILEAGGA